METDNFWEIKKKLTFTEICVEVRRLGDDYHILVSGGECPHIGCTVLAIPRPSLDGSGKMSSTASVLNVTGHKDEEVCRYLAESIGRKENDRGVHRRYSHGRDHERTDCGNCGSHADNCGGNRGQVKRDRAILIGDGGFPEILHPQKG